jgi:hypothetical protein
MILHKNLEDVAERIFWRSASADDPMEAFHKVLDDAVALYAERHPGDEEAAETFRRYVSAQIAGAARRVKARHSEFCGMRIAGSA